MSAEQPLILAIESSCDETSAAVLLGDRVLSNIIASQKVHEKYGGVVPELASRAHQANIVPVVDQALAQAGVKIHEADAIAVTQGPGLMGALHVGYAFAKSLSLALHKPLIAVNHMQAHVLAHFIRTSDEQTVPSFPFLCLTVSGGHTQLVRVDGPLNMRVIGGTIDDAAGEAFDKAAKILGLPYPGGPQIDRLAAQGHSGSHRFPRPQVGGLKYSFSGLKTSLLYYLRDQKKIEADFVEKNLADICASFQHAVVSYLLDILEQAAEEEQISTLCLAGGVSANSELRQSFSLLCNRKNWKGFIPAFEFCTDNAAMIGIAGLQLYREGITAGIGSVPFARY